MKKTILLSILIIAQLSLSAQCFPDRHNTSWHDGWVSCETSESPNPERGNSHWILYNFGQEYIMNQMHIWNANDPAHLNYGLQEVAIDYSKDGIDWTTLGTFNFDEGPGQSQYEGFEGPDFEEVETQYVLITGINNYGGECFGLSEVRFGVAGPVVGVDDPEADSKWCLNVLTYPNPFVGKTNIDISSNCDEDVYYSIYNALGEVIMPEVKLENTVKATVQFNGSELAAGIYFLQVRKGVISRQYKLVKMVE